MRSVRPLPAAALLAALMGGLSASAAAAGNAMRNFGGAYTRPRARAWHDPAKVEAARLKRERRADRNIHIARQGGIDWLGC